jgi:hypothetical protein
MSTKTSPGTNEIFDLRAYNLLLADVRVRIGHSWTAPEFDVHSTPTHRLDELLSLQINDLQYLLNEVRYVATKIRHLKELSNMPKEA